MEKIDIVTGGAGFIGSHLVKKLVSLGKTVLVIDNLITTHNTDYIDDLPKNKVIFLNAGIHEADIQTKVERILVRLNASVGDVYNLASPASVKLYTRYPMFTYLTSTVGVRNMLIIARELGDKDTHFIETSTSEAYGDPLVTPQPESYFGNVNTQCNRSCYDEGKRGAETLCYIYNDLPDIGCPSRVNVHIARLFNVYGPNNTDDRVMPTLISQALNNEPLTVFGDGTQTRSFCYVDDIVDGLIKLNQSDYHQPVNLGNPHEITINELAETIIKLTNSKSTIEYHPLPEFDPKRRCPDISLAKRVINWEPTTDLESGMNKTIDWLTQWT